MSTRTIEHCETGVVALDQQHKHLEEALKEMTYNDKCKTVDDYIVMMDRLKDEILFHFAYEEELMAGIRFPFYVDHKREHERLKAIIMDAFTALKNGLHELSPLTFHVELIKLLEETIVYHTVDYDLQIVNFVKWRKAMTKTVKSV